MITFKLLFVLCVFGSVYGRDSEVTKFMKHLSVIPDVISIGPKNFLKITYENGINADKGVELSPTQVKNQPKVTWNPERNSYYTLIVTDPDAPSRQNPIFREWHHWLVGNIPGNDIDKGEVLSQYVGAAPPKDTGLHRYVFLLYKQPKKLEFDEPRLTNTSAANREKFSAQKFAEKYNLGDPVAGNFYQAQWDSYVPILNSQLA